MAGKIYGYKYKENMDIVEIAKLIRADIKKAHPEIKASVRTSRYSMGRSIDVSLTVKFPVLNPPKFEADYVGEHYSVHPWATERAATLKKSIEDIVEAYNFDGSDIMSDYYNTNFGGSVNFNNTNAEYDMIQDLLRAGYRNIKAA